MPRKFLYSQLMIACIGIMVSNHNGYAQSANFKFDRTKPIEVTADSLIVTDNEKIGEFLGNVQITQDTYKLTAHRIIIEYSGNDDKENLVKTMTAYKDVYLFTDNQQAAYAQKMVYNLQSKILTLSGNVLLTYDKNILKGDEITVNTQTRYIKVTGNKTHRVKALLKLPQ